MPRGLTTKPWLVFHVLTVTQLPIEWRTRARCSVEFHSLSQHLWSSWLWSTHWQNLL